MGEIKSTLELIMEKTKGLNMSEEEKRAFKDNEMEKKIRGLIQKNLDGVMDVDKLKMAFTTLRRDGLEKVRGVILKEILPRITLEGDNEAILNLLEGTIEADTESIGKILADAGAQLERDRERREKDARERLEKKGISGSALLPNLKADGDWTAKVKKMEETLKRQIMSSGAGGPSLE